MSAQKIRRALLGALCGALLALTAAPAAQAAFDDPLFVFRPVPPPPPIKPMPPPTGDLEGPCGIAVGEEGELFITDYYRNSIDIFSSGLGNAGQIAEVDPLDGPCGLALDVDGSLYVNDFHRNVLKFDPSYATSTVIAGVGTLDGTHPTGVAVNQASGTVYVDQRTQVSAFTAAGSLVRVLGAGTLGDAYGMAVSEYFGSKGLVYVADAASETIKVYAPQPAIPGAGPVAEIDGSATPLGHFVSLHDSALAVDRETGAIYVTDNLQPEYADRPETVVYVFDAAGEYLGRLKYSIENALPPGLAVDNSEEATQGRVYVTSGNTERAAVYGYRPGSATTNAVPVPEVRPTGVISGAGSGSAAPASGSVGPAPAVAAASSVLGVPAPSAKGQSAQRRHRAAKRHRAKQRRASHRHAGRASR